MERHINTYGGMNKDIGYDSIPPNYYIDAQDIRITTTDGESMGSWTNIKGNKVSFSIPINSEDAFPAGEPFGPWTADNPEIIGYTTIRNRIILFVADDSNAKGWIYDVQYDPATREILPNFPSLKYYNDNLYFKKIWPIEALGRYESDCIQRVYWTDYNNFFRSLNLDDVDLVNYPVGLIDIFPDVQYTQPLLKLVTGGGQLLSGVYQIAYRLKTFDGKQTLVSPPSNLIHVVADAETLTQSAKYNADPTQVITSKALTIEIDTSNYGTFETIELISLYFEDGTSIPTAQTIEEVAIGNQPTVTFNYTGSEGTIFDLELFTFASKNYAFKTPKTITQKDSSLVVANIKGSIVSVNTLLPLGETFDAKTRRYLNDGVSTPWPIDPDPTDPLENNLKNAFNTSVDPVLYPLDPNPSAGFNTDAHWDDYWNANKQFKYQSDGITLGGEGPNITYKFHLEPFTIDGNNITPGFGNVSNIPDSPPHNLNDGYGDYANTTFPNNASPFISGLLRGYKRGETYRFGIIFYTKKGEATFVEYIGDIKFPDISDVDGAETIPGTGIQYFPIALEDSSDTIGYSLGIQFAVDFSTCPTLYNNIESYQIVRVKRQESDKRRISQGMIKTFWKYIISTPPGSSDFDLQVDGSENVLHLNPYYPKTIDTSNPTVGYINGTFLMLEDMEPYTSSGITPGGITVYPFYYVKGQYLGFYSPEISYGTFDVPALGTSLGNTPSLLLTGAYHTPVIRWLVSGPMDLTAQDLGDSCRDYRRTIRSSYPTSFYSKENIKQWVGNKHFVMTDDINYNDPVTPAYIDSGAPFHQYYMRNYYAIADFTDATGTLNDPQGGGGSGWLTAPEIYKAGTSIIGRVGKISNDPLYPANPITASTFDYFNTATEIEALDPITLAPDSLLKRDVTPIMDLVLPKTEVYGGFNYDALESNIFIPASPVIDKAISGANIFGGDIFITMFTLQTGMIEFNKDFYTIGSSTAYSQTNSTTELFPVEASINVDLAYGATVKTGVEYLHNGLQLEILRQETNNVETTYGKDNNMYRLNRVNERENDQVKFFIESRTNKNCGTPVNDIRTYLSNVKTNEENVDSWTKFEINSFYDIDDYGPINKILNWKDIVYFVQDRALGVYAINRAAITTTSDGVPTELGTGKGFGKHQYYTKEHGSIHQWGVKPTANGIYFFDAIHRKVFMFVASGTQSQNSPISEMKGIHSLLQLLPDAVFFRKENGGDNPILKKGITIGRDKINDEVLFTFLGTGNYVDFSPGITYTVGTIVFLTDSGLYYLVLVEFTASEDKETAIEQLLTNSEVLDNSYKFTDLTIVYDEIAEQFSARYSATPKIYLENGDILQSPDPYSDLNTIYTHNIGNYGEFYGVVQECEISMVINPNADINKILRTLEFNSIVRDDNKVVDRTITITGFRVKNEYQDSGVIPFSANRIKRRFDKWRVKLPRDINSVTQRGRFRSSHFIVTLYFDNQVNKELIMNRLMSYYDIQIF